MINQAVDRGMGMLADRVEHHTNVAHYLRNNDAIAMWNDASAQPTSGYQP